MKQYLDGLNFVPSLTENTPTSRGRSRLTLNQKRTQRSIICYNGNYEGDSSMFKDNQYELERFGLADTESDNEYPKDTTTHTTYSVKNNNETTSFAWRLIQCLMQQFLKPELSDKLCHKIEHFMESTWYKRFTKWWQYVTVLFTYIFYIIFIFCKRLSLLGNILWKRRVVFRNLTRRLLWWLILTKCSDLTLFALILFSSPVLLILSLFGFLICIFSTLKEALNYGANFIN